MMTIIWVLLGGAVAFALLFLYALCCVASIADDMAESRYHTRREEKS